MNGPPATFGRVHDLQVLDVHTAVTDGGGDASQSAGLVRDLDLEDRHAGADLRLRGQAQASALRLLERALHIGTTVAGHLVPELLEATDVEIDRPGDLFAIAEQDVAPQGRVGGGQTGQVSEPAGGEQ